MNPEADCTIPDKPGTIIDPDFVSYTGAELEAISTESVQGAIVTP